MTLPSKPCLPFLLTMDKSNTDTTGIDRSDLDVETSEPNEQEEAYSRKQNEDDGIMDCKDCTKLSVEVDEIKLDLAILFLKIKSTGVTTTCECESLQNENQLLKQEIKALKDKLTG